MQREESDQVPEEGPSGQVPEDTGGDSTRDEAEESAGTPDDAEEEEGQASGNPDAAG